MTYLGAPVNPPQLTFAQTDLAVHEAWGRLSLQSPRAAALAHFMVANMGREGALVVSLPTLCQITGMSISTLKRAIADLKNGRWIEVVNIGGKGGANAYVINERVAWTQGRDKKVYAHFSASILAAQSEQKEAPEEIPLRKFPMLRAAEIPLPTGKGEDPPSQPSISGFEPPLPALKDEA